MMGVLTQLLMAELLDSLVVAGHGYDTGSEPRNPGTADGGGGIGTVPIVAVLLMTAVTVGLLVSLNASGARAKLKSVGPAVVMAVVIATPLILWATSSSGGAEKSLIVERATAVTGAPEFIVYLGEDDLNTLATTKGRRSVRVVCRDRAGRVVLDDKQKWPFLTERGYDYPHVHQAVSQQQLQGADRCRLRGTRVRLEADVEGALRG